MSRPASFGSEPRRPPPTPPGVHAWLALGIGLLFGVVLYAIRAPVPRSFGLGVVIGAAAFVLLRAMGARRVEWPDPPIGRTSRLGTPQRWRLNGFDAMFEAQPGFSAHLQVRLEQLAAGLLAQNGLAPGSPEAVTLLGPRTSALLFPAPRAVGQGRPADPSRDELAALVGRLIDLGYPADRSPDPTKDS